MLRSTFALAMSALPLCACSIAHGHRPIPVDVLRVGDDGLTIQFAEILEQEFRDDGRFSLSHGGRAGVLKVTIVTDLRRELQAGKIEAHYLVDIAPAGRAGHLATGSCIETALPTCARGVIRDVLADQR
jgi:hypothetical protein